MWWSYTFLAVVLKIIRLWLQIINLDFYFNIVPATLNWHVHLKYTCQILIIKTIYMLQIHLTFAIYKVLSLLMSMFSLPILKVKVFPYHKYCGIHNFKKSTKFPICDSFNHEIKSYLRTAWKIRSYFWSVFPCIQSEYRKILTRNNSVFGHFLRSGVAVTFISIR